MASDARPEAEPGPSDIFHCRQCGECCRGFGGTLISDADVGAIAEYLGISREAFVEGYCARSGSGRVLVQGEDGFCIFAENALCRIHPVKPRMCRAWPFIEGVLRDPGNWRIMAGACPGIRADVPEQTVIRCVRAALAASGHPVPDEK
jgi:Fe-S-cluster containining protein